jgi:hypothetical protein
MLRARENIQHCNELTKKTITNNCCPNLFFYFILILFFNLSRSVWNFFGVLQVIMFLFSITIFCRLNITLYWRYATSDVIENNTLSNRQHLIAKSTRTILLTQNPCLTKRTVTCIFALQIDRHIHWKINVKGDKYVIDEELQHTDHLFLGVACFTFLNFVWKICGIVA